MTGSYTTIRKFITNRITINVNRECSVSAEFQFIATQACLQSRRHTQAGRLTGTLLPLGLDHLHQGLRAYQYYGASGFNIPENPLGGSPWY